MKPFLFLLLLVTLISSSIICSGQDSHSDHDCQEADILFVNGKVITMDETSPFAKGVAVKNGRILKVLGSKKNNIFCNVGKDTKVANLRGKFLIPGFVDAHSHFSMTAVAQNLGFSISPPPFGSVTTIPQMLQNAKDYILNNNIPAGQKVYS